MRILIAETDLCYSTTSGTFPQKGKLVGLNKDEVVLELDNGIRLHFPRTGYRVYKSQ